MLKPDRLRNGYTDAVAVGARKDHERGNERDDENTATDKAPFGKGVGVGGQNLRHQPFASDDRALLGMVGVGTDTGSNVTK